MKPLPQTKALIPIYDPQNQLIGLVQMTTNEPVEHNAFLAIQLAH